MAGEFILGIFAKQILAASRKSRAAIDMEAFFRFEVLCKKDSNKKNCSPSTIAVNLASLCNIMDVD